MTNTTDDASIQALRLLVYNDSALQARLFGLTDEQEFIAAVLQLAQSSGHTLEAEAVTQAMRAGRKAWFERNLP